MHFETRNNKKRDQYNRFLGVYQKCIREDVDVLPSRMGRRVNNNTIGKPNKMGVRDMRRPGLPVDQLG